MSSPHSNTGCVSNPSKTLWLIIRWVDCHIGTAYPRHSITEDLLLKHLGHCLVMTSAVMVLEYVDLHCWSGSQAPKLFFEPHSQVPTQYWFSVFFLFFFTVSYYLVWGVEIRTLEIKNSDMIPLKKIFFLGKYETFHKVRMPSGFLVKFSCRSSILIVAACNRSEG